MSPPNPLHSAVDEEEEEDYPQRSDYVFLSSHFRDFDRSPSMSPPNPLHSAVDEEEEEEVEEEIIEEEEEEKEVEEEIIEEEEEVKEEEEEEEVEEVEEEAEEKEDKKAVEREQENQVEKRQASLPSPVPSINNFLDLRDALAEFARQWDGLMRFLDRIDASINARFKELGAIQTPTPSDKADYVEDKVVAAAVKEEAKSGQEKPSLDDLRAELHSICQTMGSRFLRKLVVSRLSDLVWLRREVPAALWRAPDPAKLVFDSIGRFYLQGSKAFENHPTMFDSRRASILILEFYVLSGLPSEAYSSVKQDARVAALAWWSRLEREGGVKSASVVDALGLVLFVGSFGIPPDFGCEMMYDLLCLSNLKKKSDVFQQSPILRKKIRDIIKELLSKDMHAEACHLVCAFGLKEKFPPIPLLSSVVQKSWQTVKEELRGQRSLESVKEAKEKQLAVFKSVVKCAEDNKLDPSEITSYDIYQKIAKLAKETAKIKQKLKNRNHKRKAETGPLEEPETPAKRPCSASAETSLGVTPHLMKQIQEHRGPTLSDSKGLSTGFIPRSMCDDGFEGLHTGSGAGLLPGGVHGSAGSSSSLEATAATDGARLTPAGNNVGSYASISGGSHRWHQDGALDGRSFARSYSGFAPPAGWMGPSVAATQSLYQPQASSLGIEARRPISDLYRFADMVLEREACNLSTSNAMSTASNTSYHSSEPKLN